RCTGSWRRRPTSSRGCLGRPEIYGQSLGLVTGRWLRACTPAGCFSESTTNQRNRLGAGPFGSCSSSSGTDLDASHDEHRGGTMNTNHTATDPALVLDILAQLFASGSSLANGLAAVGHHLPGCQPLTSVANQLLLGVSWDEAWEQAREARHLDQLANELQFVHTSAVPSAHMLTTAATALRANRKRLAEQLAQELAIRLVLPTGICMLPSFILLGIVPMVLALLPG